jgi:hypothetical protein
MHLVEAIKPVINRRAASDESSIDEDLQSNGTECRAKHVEIIQAIVLRRGKYQYKSRADTVFA